MATYPEIFDGPGRNYSKNANGQPRATVKRYVCVHNTSNDAPARGEAAYAKVRTDGTSSHYYADDVEVLQSLDTDWRAGHVGSQQGNDGGIAYEITGVNGWSRETWLSNVAWDKVAAQMARDCQHHHIGARLLTVAEMQAGQATGFITHDLARQAWGHTDHTDPGPGFPMDHLLGLVNEHLTGVDMTPEQAMQLTRVELTVGSLIQGLQATVPQPYPGGREQSFPIVVNQILAELKARPPVQAAPVDIAALAAALVPLLPKPPTAQEVADVIAARLKD